MPLDSPSLIVGNWKMYKTREEALDYIKKLEEKVKGTSNEVVLAVPFTILHSASNAVKKTPEIKISAQNMNDAKEGAFTGEIAAKMLTDAGARYVILGHSERRRYFGETSEFINHKVKRALKEGLIPILCIGESKEENESGKREEVLRSQILEGLADVHLKDGKELIVAYEPIWAIGTGVHAGGKEAEEAHSFIREVLKEKFGDEIASHIKILYGGSVNPGNTKELLTGQNVNGLLVGGSSLDVNTFDHIINFNKQVNE